MQHVLSFESPDTLNKCLLRLTDTSIYNKDAVVTCPTLQVTVPGFSQSVVIPNVQPGFMFNLTACDLKIQKTDCGTKFFDLSDGIYILKYSVSPNDQVFVEYNHLRITFALDKIQKILCRLDVSHCDPPDKTKKRLLELNVIKMMLLAAKAKVEFCLEPRSGMDIYNYALKQLIKIECTVCV